MIEELNGDFFQQLRGFYYTAQTGSIRRAARLMNRNPSTISWQIRQLEQTLGTVLFDRSVKRLHITPEGERLLAWTISTFELLKGMRSDVGASSGILRGTISISSSLPFSAVVVGTISDFCKAHPDVRIRIRRALTYEVVDDVAGSRVDFGLTGMTQEASNCALEELFTSRPLLIARRNNQFLLPERPGMDDISRLPFISFLGENMEESDDPYFGVSLRTWPHPPNIVLSVNNYHLMLRYVKQGLGVAIMDEMCLAASSYGAAWDDIMSYSLEGILPSVRCGILMRKHKRLSPQAAALLENIRIGIPRHARAMPLLEESTGESTGEGV
ncbi:MAG: LysR family transcriptional regulator [Desulfovibrionaceae bacterium]|nr:LysR family transcriptional regulator [Desulfovibrionaceae bacterium]